MTINALKLYISLGCYINKIANRRGEELFILNAYKFTQVPIDYHLL